MPRPLFGEGRTSWLGGADTRLGQSLCEDDSKVNMSCDPINYLKFQSWYSELGHTEGEK
jgi:hypothetical protein